MSLNTDHDALEALRAGRRIEGRSALGGFAYALAGDAPSLAVALHSGNAVREELLPWMVISPEDRFREEDPATDTMIRGCPNAIWALDSRAEYDLNRPLERAVPVTPEHFWGLRVYRDGLPETLIRRSLEKYNAFYRFVEGCVRVLLARFGYCIIYEIHSYNLIRQVKKGIVEPPLFNLGTALTDGPRFRSSLDGWLERLAEIQIPDVHTTVAENLVFRGASEFCRRALSWDTRVLNLPTEIGKYYMDERVGELYWDRVDALVAGLRRAITAHAALPPGT